MTPYQIAILVIALITTAMIFNIMMDMRQCNVALAHIDNLEVCQACDVLEQAGVIQRE